jgi:uncharacterized SAM-binding protein YcdF (DUF218 family)
MNFVDAIFYPTKILAALVLPPVGLILLALLALILLKRWPRTARATLWVSILSLLFLSLPVVSHGLVAAVEGPPFDQKTAPTAQAVMILGGGLIRATPEYGDTPSTHSLVRARYGARLAKQYRLPILVTGGQVYGGTPEAELMARSLADDFGVPVKWVETRSRHTAENARFSAALLKTDHIQRVLLVTEEFHMRRALAHCEAAGLICIPAPVSSESHASDSWIQQLPNPHSLAKSEQAIHEILGVMVLRWR